jgi:hypothetical protein
MLSVFGLPSLAEITFVVGFFILDDCWSCGHLMMKGSPGRWGGLLTMVRSGA